MQGVRASIAVASPSSKPGLVLRNSSYVERAAKTNTGVGTDACTEAMYAVLALRLEEGYQGYPTLSMMFLLHPS